MGLLGVNDFLEYDRANPLVWEHFKRFALEAVKAGRRNFGAKAVLERIRWYVEVETRGDAFKCNNDYAAFYARKFLECYPEYLGFFRRRSSVADGLYPPEALARLSRERGRLWSNRPGDWSREPGQGVESSTTGVDSRKAGH